MRINKITLVIALTCLLTSCKLKSSICKTSWDSYVLVQSERLSDKDLTAIKQLAPDYEVVRCSPQTIIIATPPDKQSLVIRRLRRLGYPEANND